MKSIRLINILLIAFISISYCYGQSSKKNLEVLKISNPPVIDGSLTDSCWLPANSGTDFIVCKPTPLAKPTYQTDVKILYNDKGIYIGAMLYDAHPDSILYEAGPRDYENVNAKQLSELAEFFVQDAFGTVHRAHASTAGVNKFLPSAAGFLLEKEIKYLGGAMQNPARPFVAILGGAKVSDKIGVIENLLNKVDVILIGGAMAYTFLRAMGIKTGKSRVEEDKLDLAKELLKKSSKIRFLMPVDHIIADKIDQDASSEESQGLEIKDGWMGVDIGSMTQAIYSSVIAKAKTIVLNGPMGVFEIDKFATGTYTICKAIADSTSKGAISIIGGGDSVSAVKNAGVASKMSHISTGGGASLEFLEGKELPGIAALKNK